MGCRFLSQAYHGFEVAFKALVFPEKKSITVRCVLSIIIHPPFQLCNIVVATIFEGFKIGVSAKKLQLELHLLLHE